MKLRSLQYLLLFASAASATVLRSGAIKDAPAPKPTPIEYVHFPAPGGYCSQLPAAWVNRTEWATPRVAYDNGECNGACDGPSPGCCAQDSSCPSADQHWIPGTCASSGANLETQWSGDNKDPRIQCTQWCHYNGDTSVGGGAGKAPIEATDTERGLQVKKPTFTFYTATGPDCADEIVAKTGTIGSTYQGGGSCHISVKGLGDIGGEVESLGCMDRGGTLLSYRYGRYPQSIDPANRLKYLWECRVGITTHNEILLSSTDQNVCKGWKYLNGTIGGYTKAVWTCPIY